MSGKPLSQGTYMPNMKALSETVQKLWPMLFFFFKVGHRSRSRSQVKFILYEWEALVTRNLHAKYKGSNSNGSKVMTKQEAHGPQLAHLSETATADMQMACNIFPILLWQGNGLNSFWNILLTRLKCWNFQNVTSKTSHPQCLLPTFESTGISVQ